MSLSMAPLLMHSEYVSVGARDAIRAAYGVSPARRGAWLESAARILHLETGLDCRDVLELVGLPEGGSCRGEDARHHGALASTDAER